MNENFQPGVVMKNYYLILGVSSSATLEEIKSAFRRRAMELHPDRSGMESGPFQELQEAYGVLGDPERRRRYDGSTDVTVVRRASRRRSAEPLAGRRRPEPFDPLNPFGSETQTQTIRDVSLAESLEFFHPSFDEIFDRLWRNFEDVTRTKGNSPSVSCRKC
jgi:curved DNA-binding protein CbpA